MAFISLLAGANDFGYCHHLINQFFSDNFKFNEENDSENFLYCF